MLLLQLVMLGTMLIAAISLAAAAQAEGKPTVAWAVEFDSEQDLADATITTETHTPAPPPPDSVKDVRIEDGVLHFGGLFGAKSDPGNYVYVSWGKLFGKTSAPSPKPMPLIDTTKFPILEIKWRIEPKFAPYDRSPQYDLYWNYQLPNGENGIAYTTGPYSTPGEWTVVKIRFAPDSSAPGPWTPRYVNAVGLAIGRRMCPEPAWVDVDYIRIRAFTDEEAAAEKTRVEVLGGYKSPEIPDRIKDTFLYGVYSATSGNRGGAQACYDDLVRCHMNLAAATGTSKEESAAAQARGVYQIASPGSLESQSEKGDYAGMLEGVDKLTADTKDQPSIIGWYIRDEPLIVDLWGVISTKAALERAMPDRMGLFILHSEDIARYYDRFSTVVWTDHYPFCSGLRNPHEVADWCRSISKLSSRRQWFTPQAFGDVDWYRCKEGFDYYRPSREQFRLMMNLALANGARAFAIFLYQIDLCSALADTVGNPTDLLEEATKLGGKWAETGPLLLDSRPVLDAKITVEAGSNTEKGVTVAAMGDPAAGPVFLLAVNENLSEPISAKASIPEEWSSKDRTVLDLYSLKSMGRAGARSFPVAELQPGEGRLYMLGTREQIDAAKRQVLANRAKELLRVQNADRLIAQRWGLELGKYDRAKMRVEQLLSEAKPAQAMRVAEGAAARAMADVMASEPSLVETGRLLLDARGDIGSAYQAVYEGSEKVRTGKETFIDRVNSVCREYSDLREAYVAGNRAGLPEKCRLLQKTAAELKAQTGGR